MKRGKEIQLNLHENYTVVSGTVDNKQPKSIYIQISTWGLPKTTHPDYEKLLRRKTSRVKRKLSEVLNGTQFHKNRCIVDFNMASSGITEGKRSYMCVEMTLFKKPPLIPVNSEELKPTLNSISKNIIDVFESDEDFDFFKRKK
jgi:hypothetical protein